MNEINKEAKQKISGVNIYILCVIAIIGAVFKGGLLEGIGAICLLISVFYLIKNRKLLSRQDKLLGWCLVIVWAVVNGIVKGV